MAKRFQTGKLGETTIGGVARDNTPRHSKIDTSTHVIPAMEYEHYTIHNGFHYFYTDKFELASAATKEFFLSTPEISPVVHMKFICQGSPITQFDLYEGPSKLPTTDSRATVFNSNRNSTDTAQLTIDTTLVSSTDSDGTLIKTYKGGAASQQSRQGEAAKSDEEIVLKRDSAYLIRFTSGTADNLCDMTLLWYELVAES
jgi:hypothetical protein